MRSQASVLFAAAVCAPALSHDSPTWTSPGASPGSEVRVDDRGHRALGLAGIQIEPAPELGVPPASWQALGPFGGDIADVQVSPIDANTVLAALAPASGGAGTLYRSTNAGGSWSAVPTLAGRSCYDIAFAPDGTAYVGTIDSVWKSTDGGASFTQLNLGIGLNDQVFEIDVDPTNPLRLWCGVADALGGQPVNVMLSTNGGTSWTNRTPPLASPMSCTGISVDPANNQEVFACFGGGFGGGQVWVTANEGVNWVNRSAGLPNNPMTDVVHDGARVLLCGGQLFGGQTVGLYSTVNDGVTWTPVHDGTWPSLVIHDIAIDPNNANVILVASAGQGVFRTTNGGTSWTFQAGGTGSLSVNAISFSPGSSTTIYTGSSSNAVWKSTDSGASFAASSNGIGALTAYSVGSNPLNPHEIAIAFQGLNDGGVYTTLDGGDNWSLAALPPTRYSCVRFASTGQLYAISSGPSSIAPEGLYRRTGASWSGIGPDQGTLFESDLLSMRVSQNDPNLIWATGSDFGVAGAEPTIWRTTTGGGPGQWTKTYEGALPSEDVQDLIVVDPAADTTLLAVYTDFGSAPQEGGVLRSVDGGQGWLPSDTGLPATPQCTSLAVSPTDPDTFFLSNNVFSGQQGVFRSTDQGQSWSGTGFVGQVLRVATDATDPNVLYIGQNGATKVRVSIDGGAIFSPYDTGLAAAGFVLDMRRSEGPGSQMLLASSTGAYATDLNPEFTEFCAGDGSLATACPCGNTGQPGRGCENSATTGGALLWASGDTSPDTVVLSSMGERSTALSVFLQGNAELGVPALFGDGVRCIGGILKRLYSKSAVGGVATAPGTGDPSITTRSAALGHPIAPGSTRSYQTYYRDAAPGFCPDPPGNTWNASSGVRILW